MNTQEIKPKRCRRDSQFTPCQVPMKSTAFVSNQNVKVRLMLSVVKLQNTHSMPMLGKICEGQKSCRIIVRRQTAAILLSLTGLICSWLFNNVRLLLKILFSDKVDIILMKTSWAWRLYQKSISKNLLEIKQFIVYINIIFVWILFLNLISKYNSSF